MQKVVKVLTCGVATVHAAATHGALDVDTADKDEKKIFVDSMEAFELEEAMNAERTPGWAHDDWVYIEAPMQSIKRLAIFGVSEEEQNEFREIAGFNLLAYSKASRTQELIDLTKRPREWEGRGVFVDSYPSKDVGVWIRKEGRRVVEVIIAWTGTRIGSDYDRRRVGQDLLADWQVWKGCIFSDDCPRTDLGYRRFQAAIRLASNVASAYPRADIILTGHSLGGAIALEASHEGIFPNLDKRSVRCIAYNPWTALHSEKYMTQGEINGGKKRPAVTILYNRLDPAVATVTSAIATTRWYEKGLLKGDSIFTEGKWFSERLVRVPQFDGFDSLMSTEVEAPEDGRRWYPGKFVFSALRYIGELLVAAATFAYEQHTLLQFMPDDLVKYFDPYGEVAIEDYLLEAADTDMENEHPLPLFEDDATIF